MQLIDGQPVFSATDLVGYLACEHLTALERAALAGLVQKPMREDRELDVIRRRGFEHEARYLASLGNVVEIGKPWEIGWDEAAALTEQAVCDGARCVYQATFVDGNWRESKRFDRFAERFFLRRQR